MSGGDYPDFLFPDGMTDTDFFTYANTNDRGRDPRAAYRENQDRFTWIFATSAAWKLSPRWNWNSKARLIIDSDLRNTTINDADDYSATLVTAQSKLGYQASDKASAAIGLLRNQLRRQSALATTISFDDN